MMLSMLSLSASPPLAPAPPNTFEPSIITTTKVFTNVSSGRGRHKSLSWAASHFTGGKISHVWLQSRPSLVAVAVDCTVVAADVLDIVGSDDEVGSLVCVGRAGERFGRAVVTHSLTSPFLLAFLRLKKRRREEIQLTWWLPSSIPLLLLLLRSPLTLKYLSRSLPSLLSLLLERKRKERASCHQLLSTICVIYGFVHIKQKKYILTRYGCPVYESV